MDLDKVYTSILQSKSCNYSVFCGVYSSKDKAEAVGRYFKSRMERKNHYSVYFDVLVTEVVVDSPTNISPYEDTVDCQALSDLLCFRNDSS